MRSKGTTAALCRPDSRRDFSTHGCSSHQKSSRINPVRAAGDWLARTGGAWTASSANLFCSYGARRLPRVHFLRSDCSPAACVRRQGLATTACGRILTLLNAPFVRRPGCSANSKQDLRSSEPDRPGVAGGGSDGRTCSRRYAYVCSHSTSAVTVQEAKSCTSPSQLPALNRRRKCAPTTSGGNLALMSVARAHLVAERYAAQRWSLH